MKKKPRGFYGIGVFNPKTEDNIGTLWRSAHNFGASFIFTIGRRYKKQASDTLKTWKTIPLFNYEDFEEFNTKRPFDSILIGIEQHKRSKELKGFVHPDRAVYVLGAEDYGLPEKYLGYCNSIVEISSPMCLNVAVAGSIIMHDRIIKL